MIRTVLLTAFLSGSADQPLDLVDTAAGAGGFGTLLAAAEKAGLVEALRTADSLTILAPTDEAFAKVPETLLQKLLQPENQESLATLLRYHVIAGSQSAGQLLNRRQLATLEGSNVSFTLQDGLMRANEARVLSNDIAASNGVIHVIDQVLIPDGFSLPTKVQTPAALIELAVSRGVPLFNNGQQAACAAVYEVTARSLLMLGDGQISEAGMSRLRKALDKAGSQSNPAQQAWTLRDALDEVWNTLEKDMPTNSATEEATTSSWTSLFEFGRDEAERSSPWFSVNDNVMGGVSRGGFEQATDTTAAFRGALSLENNGGFSTMRSPAKDLQLGGHEGVVMRVRGDGRTYALGARMSDRWTETRTFKRQFATQAGEWQEVRIPFSELELSVMGRRFPGTSIDPAAIRSIGFSISDKNESPFRLEIDWIRAYRSGSITY